MKLGRTSVAAGMFVALSSWGCEDSACSTTFEELCSQQADEVFAMGDRAPLEGARIEVCVDATCHEGLLSFARSALGPSNLCGPEQEPAPALRCALASTADHADALRVSFAVPIPREDSYAVDVTIRIFDPRAPASLLSERAFRLAYRVDSRQCGRLCVTTAPHG